ncbi:MAG: AbrB/MazE/SpoVT family DNA-binding domain-containing protein [Candidatus Methanoperedens sp.]|nr:AbrB/MazE/SpoVT family DNA-binding domain-containing protein [Candidatus Methanoperedens sp.]
MKRKIQHQGSSLSAVIPAEFVKDLKIKVGDIFDFSIDKGRIIMTPVPSPAKDRSQGSKHIPKGMIDNDT